MAPTLEQAIAMAAGKAYVIIDGSLLRMDRVAMAGGNFGRPSSCCQRTSPTRGPVRTRPSLPCSTCSWCTPFGPGWRRNPAGTPAHRLARGTGRSGGRRRAAGDPRRPGSRVDGAGARRAERPAPRHLRAPVHRHRGSPAVGLSHLVVALPGGPSLGVRRRRAGDNRAPGPGARERLQAGPGTVDGSAASACALVPAVVGGPGSA